MATVVQKPRSPNEIGAALGGGLGKGLSDFLIERADRQKKQEFLDSLNRYEDALAAAGSFEKATKVNPFQFIDPRLISGPKDIAAITSFRDSRVNAMFPEQVAGVTPEGDLAGLVAKGRRGVTEPVLTASEFSDIETARAKKAAAGKGKGKFTLSDKKLEVILRMEQNERDGLPREHGLTSAEIELVASDLSDPITGQALRLALESREFFKLKTVGQKAAFVQTLVDTIQRLRKGSRPTGAAAKTLGKEVIEKIDLSNRQPNPQTQRGTISKQPEATAAAATPTAFTTPAPAPQKPPPVVSSLPLDLQAKGVTEADISATLEFLQRSDPTISREMVIEAMRRKNLGKR